MGVKEFVKERRVLREGKNIHDLHKEIDLMTLSELEKEFVYLATKERKSDVLDDRLKELLREYYTYDFKNQYDSNIELFMKHLIVFESESAKKEVASLQAGLYSTKFLDRLDENIVELPIPKNVVREARINKVKRGINVVTDRITRPFRRIRNTDTTEASMSGYFGRLMKYKPNPLRLEISERERKDFIEDSRAKNRLLGAILFMNNYDLIDFDNYLYRAKKENIIDIYQELPEYYRKKLAKTYMNSGNFKRLTDEEKEEVIKTFEDSITHKDLVNLYFENVGNRFGEEPQFLKNIEITDDDILESLQETHGYVPYKFQDRAMEIVKQRKSWEEILEILESEDRRNLFIYVRAMNEEQLLEVINKSSIDDEKKASIIKNYCSENDVERQIELFKKLLPIQQQQYFDQIYIRELLKEKNKQLIYDQIKDEKFKKAFGVLYLNHPCTMEELAGLLKEGYNQSAISNRLEAFSDVEIRDFYEKTDDVNFRSILLSFERSDKEDDQNKRRGFFSDLSYKKTPVVLNDQNYVELLKSARCLSDYVYLLSAGKLEEVELKDLVDIFKKVGEMDEEVPTNSIYTTSSLLENIRSQINDKIQLSDLELLMKDGIVRKSDIIAGNASNLVKDDLDGNSFLEQLSIIEKLEDVELKKYLLDMLYREMFEDYIYRRKIRKISTAEVEQNNELIYKSFRDKVLDEKTDTTDKYLYLSMLLEKYGSVPERFEEIKQLFEKVNEESGKTEYNEIFELERVYDKDPTTGERYITGSYVNIAQCMPYLNSDKVYELIKKLYQGNKNVGQTLNQGFLTDESLIDNLDYNIIEYLSRFGVAMDTKTGGYNNEFTSQKMDVFVKVYDRLKSIKAYPEEKAMTIFSFVKNLNEKDLEGINLEDTTVLDTLLYLSLDSKAGSEFRGMVTPRLSLNGKVDTPRGAEAFIQYREDIKEKARQSIHTEGINRRKALDAIGKRFFNLPYEKLQELRDVYSTDLSELLKKYDTKIGPLTLEEENEIKALRILNNITELLEIQDIDALIRTFDELDKEEEFANVDFFTMSVLEENLKRAYSKDSIDQTYEPDEKDRVDTTEDSSLDGIAVYKPEDFKMYVHVVAAFGDYALIDEEHPEISARDKWNDDSNGKRNHILCTSFIGNTNLCYARRPDVTDEKVIFGFTKIDSSSILMASTGDIGSDTEALGSDRSWYRSEFRLGDKYITECRHGHNEIDVERRMLNNKQQNIEPDYIVCFNEINEASKKVARDFGIPIVLIDKQAVAEQQSDRLDQMVKEFINTKNPELLDKIINSYHCLRMSYAVGDADKRLRDKYFDPEEMNHKVEKIMSAIEAESKLGDKEKADRCYVAFLDAFEHELQLCKSEHIDPEENLSDGKFKFRKFRYDLKKIVEKRNLRDKKVEDASEQHDSLSRETDRMSKAIRKGRESSDGR